MGGGNKTVEWLTSHISLQAVRVSLNTEVVVMSDAEGAKAPLGGGKSRRSEFNVCLFVVVLSPSNI